MLFLGEKGQAKSRLMRLAGAVSRRRDSVHRHARGAAARRSVSSRSRGVCKRFVAEHAEDEVPIAWWPREERYAERLAPGTKFADIIGEIDPAKLAGGTSMSAEEALHFGLIPRMHRGIFAMNELPELDELVQVGLFNILEERDVQIRGYPIKFDIDVLILFSANPGDLQPQRQGDSAAQGPHRLGDSHALSARARSGHPDHGARSRPSTSTATSRSSCRTSCARSSSRSAWSPASRSTSTSSRASARGSASPTIARWSPAPGSAARVLGERPAVPRISDLGHLYSSSLGKLELDLMGSHQMTERQVLDAVLAEAIQHRVRGIRRSARPGGDRPDLFARREDRSRRPAALGRLRRTLEARAAGLGQGVRSQRLERPGRAGLCVEFVLAGLYATDRISRSQKHGSITYDL